MLKNFKLFEQTNLLMLPPPKGYDNNNDKIVLTLEELYKLSNRNVENIANKINSFINKGYNVKVHNTEFEFKLNSKNEPVIIFGTKGNREISIGGYRGINIEKDSIVIFIQADKVLHIYPMHGELDNLEFTFTKPKIIISDVDPLGEEDWSDD